MKCPKCNVELNEGSRFCSNCGFEFNKNDKTENKNIVTIIVFWIIIMIVSYLLCMNIPFVPDWVGSRAGKLIVIIELLFCIKELWVVYKK